MSTKTNTQLNDIIARVHSPARMESDVDALIQEAVMWRSMALRAEAAVHKLCKKLEDDGIIKT